jgi:tRNA threonylcarbamoyladenosine biosynthesis protein TsaE
MQFISKSQQETFEFGQKIGKSLKGGEVITLDGELGAGKTVFTKGLATALGITDEITSPTFTILNIYENSPLTLYHYDAYRLKSGEEAYGSGLTDYLCARDGVCVIEWAQNIASALPKKIIKIQINYLNATEREIIYEL